MLGRVVGAAALGLTAIATAEQGWRYGQYRGNDRINSYAANSFLRGSSGSSDNFVIGALEDGFRNSLLDTTPMQTVTKTWCGITGAIGNMAKNWLPLTIGALGCTNGTLGWISAGILGVGALYNGLVGSGRISNSPRSNFMDTTW